ncbi:MAG: PH domain-containing protein [Bryobacterales bacterium]|nr:PH domain-containing protein [Bryobacterales bacterium]
MNGALFGFSPDAMKQGDMRDSAGPYPTRVDGWLGAVAASYVLVALGLPAWHLGTVVGSSQPFDLGPVVSLPLVAWRQWRSLPCEYSFEKKLLVVRSGLLRVRIPLLAITLVSPSRSLASAPAWSLDRLEIRYGRTQRVVISPKEKAAFVGELEQRAPHLVREGERLVVAEEWKTPGEA